MNEQAKKRSRGRPRFPTRRQHIDITLAADVLDALDAVTDNRSAFIEALVREHVEVKQFIDLGAIAYMRDLQ